MRFSGVSYSFFDDSIVTIECDPTKEDFYVEHEGDMTTVGVGGISIIVEYGTLKVEIV
ncbi:hypothetical protein [Bacillus phage vB_BtM_BMBsp2]|nr:hypothetical protein [Bacillus phage vB_BtM_BMBsp2]